MLRIDCVEKGLSKTKPVLLRKVAVASTSLPLMANVKYGDTPNDDAHSTPNFDLIDPPVTDEVSFGVYSVEEKYIRLEAKLEGYS